MSNLYFIFLVITVWVTMPACSPAPISEEEALAAKSYSFSKVNCYVRYIAQKLELQAEMTFRADSTMGIKGEVSINEEPMIFKTLPMVGFQYRLIKRMPKLDSVYVFKYTEKDGSVVKMDIGLSPFEKLRVASKGISQKTGGLLEWDGAPLGGEDGLVLVFTDSEGNTFSVNHAGITKGNQFEILGQHSSRLALGKGTLNATRKRTIFRQEGESAKVLTLEYYLKQIEFQVNK